MGGELKRIPPINQNFDKVHVNKILSLPISLTTDPGVPSHHSLSPFPIICYVHYVKLVFSLQTELRPVQENSFLEPNFPKTFQCTKTITGLSIHAALNSSKKSEKLMRRFREKNKWSVLGQFYPNFRGTRTFLQKLHSTTSFFYLLPWKLSQISEQMNRCWGKVAANEQMCTRTGMISSKSSTPSNFFFKN